MLINEREINISSLTPEDVKDGAVINILGMDFKPSCEFEEIEDEQELRTIYLKPVTGGDKILEEIRAWKDRLIEKYECEIWDEDTGSLPDYSIEFGYEGDDDRWTVKICTNAFNFDNEIRIEIE